MLPIPAAIMRASLTDIEKKGNPVLIRIPFEYCGDAEAGLEPPLHPFCTRQIVIVSLRSKDRYYSGVMTMCESSDDVEYNFCANLKRAAVLFPRSLLRRSVSSPTRSFTWRR